VNIKRISIEEGYLIVTNDNNSLTKYKALGPLVKEATPVSPVKAALTTALAGANNDLVFTAVTEGANGNLITIEYVDSGVALQPLVVTVVGNAIVVTLELDDSATPAIVSTAADILAAIEASVAALALVTVADSGEDTGAGVVIEMEATALTGGVSGEVAEAGALRFDNTFLYVNVGASTESTSNWKKITLESL